MACRLQCEGGNSGWADGAGPGMQQDWAHLTRCIYSTLPWLKVTYLVNVRAGIQISVSHGSKSPVLHQHFILRVKKTATDQELWGQ